MFPGLGGGASWAAHACRIVLQETLIIDQQIPNVNRAIRPENTDIHHPDTNYAASPDVITGAQLDASSHPHPAPLHTALCWVLLWGHSHAPPGPLWPQLRSPAVLSSNENRRSTRSLCFRGRAAKDTGQTPDHRPASVLAPVLKWFTVWPWASHSSFLSLSFLFVQRS